MTHHDLDRRPVGLGTRFVSARQAARLVPDHASVISCGRRPSILISAIRDRFAQTRHPKGLTWCAVAGIGPEEASHRGSLAELARPGLVTTAVFGRLTGPSPFLDLAMTGQLELHTMPSGPFAGIVEAQGLGRLGVFSEAGLGTYLDPRVGPGSRLNQGGRSQFVEAAGDKLRYSLPPLEVAILDAPAADEYGNLHGALEVWPVDVWSAARAVHANGGTVIVRVDGLVPHDERAIRVPADWIDAIVVDGARPGQGSGPRIATNPMLGRLAVSVIAERVGDGAVVHVGDGLATDAPAFIADSLLAGRLVLTADGDDAVGTDRGCDVACFEMFQVDARGDVNATRRGPRPVDIVGAGSLPDRALRASTVVFVGPFAAGERIRRVGHGARVDVPGVSAFVHRVREISFVGAAALARGQTVLFVTSRGVFRLVDDGLLLTQVVPGLDVPRDVLLPSGARIVLPECGLEHVRKVAPEIVFGDCAERVGG